MALDHPSSPAHCSSSSSIHIHTEEGIEDDDLSLDWDADSAQTNFSVKAPASNPRRQQLEADLWQARLGHCGEWQLKVIPHAVNGTPSEFTPHPFSLYDHYNRARIRKVPATKGKHPSRASDKQQRFYMDFGFLRASNFDYSRPDDSTNRIIQSFDGYNSYLLVVDEHTRHVWVFLCKSKEPPLNLINLHLDIFGSHLGGSIRCDHGGELARSHDFVSQMTLRQYTVEPTGADNPSQNKSVEKWNDILATTVRVLLYGSGLPATFWSAALLHAVWLHNRRVHQSTMMTPFEAWHGVKPDLSNLRVFGSRVCVKRTGKRRCKLDRHDQMLYDIGLEYVSESIMAPPPGPPPRAVYPSVVKPPKLPTKACLIPLPLRLTSPPDLYLHAAAARTQTLATDILVTGPTPTTKMSLDHEIMLKHDITKNDMMMVYLSPHPFRNSFQEEFRLRFYDHTKHPTAGLVCKEKNGRLYLRDIMPSTPGAKIRAWKSRIRNAWLINVNGTGVSTVEELKNVFAPLATEKTPMCTLLMAHSEIKDGLVESGIPQINSDQLNHRYSFKDIAVLTQDEFDSWFARLPRSLYELVNDGGVTNLVTVANKLTRRILLQQQDWEEWTQSEYTQLDQYAMQHMFGEPCPITKKSAVFNLIWTYVIKELDGRRKARCTCDGSTRGGQVRVLDHTFANSIDQTGSKIFYAIAAAENLLVFGADVSNAFGEAPPPKQGFYITPDVAFKEWYVSRYGKEIPDGWVIPVLAAMQGHPESPRLWEKHCDRILRNIGLLPTIHEPCLYSGHLGQKKIYFKRQVDDFAVACEDERTANIIYDAIDEALQMPIKRQGLVTLFNGLDVLQSQWFIKISVETYLSKTLEPYFKDWLDIPSKPLPVPLGTNDTFHKELYHAKGNPDAKIQAQLAKHMGFGYRKAIGELIWPMTTCRPDLSQAVMKCASASAAPTEIHYNAVKSIFRYLAGTMKDGIYFWRTQPRMDLPEDEPPHINSTPQDLQIMGRPREEPLKMTGYMDSSWADCPLTRRLTGGHCLRLAGGPIAWKGRLWPTVAQSFTEAEYYEANDAGKQSLYCRSIMWDLGIPQEADNPLRGQRWGNSNGKCWKTNITNTTHRYQVLCSSGMGRERLVSPKEDRHIY